MKQLTLKPCNHLEVETLTALLEEHEALAITYTDQFDNPILEPLPGETPLWNDVVIQAIFDNLVQDAEIINLLKHTHPNLDIQIETLPDQDWVRTSVQDLEPQRFGQRLWICPSWIEPPDPHAINVTLDPGLAFGTGTHPTTSLCLTWLEQATLNHKTLIDFGCGSGILGIAALKLGAQHVFSVDIDEQALIATQDNAINNHIDPTQISIDQPNTLKFPTHYILANILLTPLINLKHRFYSLLRSEGHLIVSGILAEQSSELIAEYSPEFEHLTSMLNGDWALLVFQKKEN